MVGRMDGTILPTTQGIKFIRRSRFWKLGSSRLLRRLYGPDLGPKFRMGRELLFSG